MDIKKLNDGLSVTGQVAPEELADLAASGFKTVIVNRPDNEGDDQPSFAEIEAAANAVGLTAIYQPIIPGQIDDDQIKAFRDALDTSAGPVLAFCRTGNRSATLFERAQKSKS